MTTIKTITNNTKFILNVPKFFPNLFVGFFMKKRINPRTTTAGANKHSAIIYAKEVLNQRIERSFFNYLIAQTNVIQPKNFYQKESFSQINPIHIFIKKELVNQKINKKLQLFHNLKSLCLSLQTGIFKLYLQTSLVNINLSTHKNFVKKDILILSLFNTIYQSQNIFPLSLYNPENTQSIFAPLFSNIFSQCLPSYINISFALLLSKHITLKYPFFSKHLLILLFTHYSFTKTAKSLAKPYSILNAHKIYRLAKLNTILTGRNVGNISKFHKSIQYSAIDPAISLWKKNNSTLPKHNLKKFTNKRFFIFPTQHIFTLSNTDNFIKRTKNRATVARQIIYTLLRLEEKIDVYSKINTTEAIKIKDELIKLYNMILYFLQKKSDRVISTSLILANITELFKIKQSDWKSLSLISLNNWLKNALTYRSVDRSKINKFFNTFYQKITSKNLGLKRIRSSQAINAKININYPISAQKNIFTSIAKPRFSPHSQITVRKPLINETIKLKNNYIHFKQTNQALSILTNKSVKLFFINALSLTKYAFNFERQLEKKEKRSPTIFLQNIDRDMINKYKYVAVYIKDLIRVCFIGMFLKKADFIAKFIAFQLAKLPRNRKETSFIKFIIKVVKTFAAEREEILGLRIKFKGRVNRWRRTKAIVGERGVIPAHTITNRIEYGTSHAINRKGAVGIRIWIYYHATFSATLKKSLLKYFLYSKRVHLTKRRYNFTYFTKTN